MYSAERERHACLKARGRVYVKLKRRGCKVAAREIEAKMKESRISSRTDFLPSLFFSLGHSHARLPFAFDSSHLDSFI